MLLTRALSQLLRLPSCLLCAVVMQSHVTVARAKVLSLLLGTLLPLIMLLDFGTAFLLFCVVRWQFEHHSAVTPTPLHAELVMRGAGP